MVKYFKALAGAVLALLGNTSAGDLPDNTGKFFYLELNHASSAKNLGTESHFHFEMKGFGDNTDATNWVPLRLTPTSNEQAIEISLTTCPSNMCQDRQLDPNHKNANIGTSAQVQGYDVNLLRSTQLLSNTLTFKYGSGLFIGELSKYHRYTEIGATRYYGIVNSLFEFGSSQPGAFLGFQPYTAVTTPGLSTYNLMSQLVTLGLIDKNIVSFGLRSEYGNSSYIKFGGYDQVAIKGNTTDNLHMFTTQDNKKWSVPLTGIRFNNGNKKVPIEGLQNMELDPAVPYIYVPAKSFTYDNIAKQLEQDLGFDFTADCTSNSFCFWKKSCTDIKSTLNNETALISFDVKKDDGTIISHHMPIFHYFLDTSEIDSRPEYKDTCTLGIFKSNNNYQNDLVVGYNFMKQFYVVYDGSKLPQTAQIGIAERNRTIDIGQIRYEPNYIGYERLEKSKDMSKIMKGFADQYDVVPNPNPDIKPNYPDDPDNVKPDDGDDTKVSNKTTMWIAIGGSIVAALILATVGIFCCCKKKGRASSYEQNAYDDEGAALNQSQRA